MILLTKTPENPMINKSLNLPEGEGFRFNSPQYPEFYNSSRGFWRSLPRISWGFFGDFLAVQTGDRRDCDCFPGKSCH